MRLKDALSEEALLKTCRPVLFSPDLKRQALTAAHTAWQEAPARRSAPAWLYPLMELAASVVILMTGMQINSRMVAVTPDRAMMSTATSESLEMTIASSPRFFRVIGGSGFPVTADSLRDSREMLQELLHDGDAVEPQVPAVRQNSMNGSSYGITGVAS